MAKVCKLPARELFGLCAQLLFFKKAGRPCVWACEIEDTPIVLGPGQGRLTSSAVSRRCYKDQRPFRSATMVFWRAFSCSILHCSDTGEKVHSSQIPESYCESRYDMSTSRRVCKVYWFLHFLFRAASYFLISADGEIPVPFPPFLPGYQMRQNGTRTETSSQSPSSS